MPAKKATPVKKVVKKDTPPKTTEPKAQVKPAPTLVTEEVIDTAPNEVTRVVEDITPNTKAESSQAQTVEEMDAGTPARSKHSWLALFVGLLIGAVVGAGVMYALEFRIASSRQVTASSAPTPSLTPSPSPQLKRADLKVQVLNGSGLAGAAAKAKDLLEGLGYKDVKVGNAGSSDVVETEVAIKNEKKNYRDQLIKDLAKAYTVASKSSELKKDSDFDAVVTLGSK